MLRLRKFFFQLAIQVRFLLKMLLWNFLIKSKKGIKSVKLGPVLFFEQGRIGNKHGKSSAADN